MQRRLASSGFTRFVRAHERMLVAVVLVGLALFAGIASIGVLVDSIRVPVLDRVEQIINYWDDRWTRRLEHGERLVNARDYPRAVAYLAALDREFPAQSVRHKRDMERERLLHALARSYSELGKKRLALDTYRRLVEFDPRNYESRHLLAQACLRFGETDLAVEHIGELLKIHPTHMPSVRALLKIHFDKGNFASVVETYESYLNAFLVQPVEARLGQSSAKFNVPVDGRFHAVELRLNHSPDAPAELALAAGQLAIEIKRVAVEAPLLVAKPGAAAAPLWPGATAWRLQEMAPIGAGSYRALGPGAALRLDVSPQPRGVAKLYLTLRLFKPLDPELWAMVQKSYERLLKYDELKAARARSVEGIPVGAGA
ncbi:MAG: tetratricopeptide repeat protein [Candidatus Binatia bacterium]